MHVLITLAPLRFWFVATRDSAMLSRDIGRSVTPKALERRKRRREAAPIVVFIVRRIVALKNTALLPLNGGGGNLAGSVS